VSLSRAERERIAYDERGVWDHSHAWHLRGQHVFECPNTLRHERLFDELTVRHAAGGRVLDIGCGTGASSQKLLMLGARYVLGIDISEKAIETAMTIAVPGQLEFVCGDLNEPVGGRFDLVSGRAILHHLEYRPILCRLFQDNLAPDGAMVFMEPLRENLVGALYRGLAHSAHTDDERPFDRRDLRWFRDTFELVDVYPYNYFSFPLGVLSTLVASRADNALLRLCDRADTWLAGHARWMEARFRQAILVIRKPDR
jgi:SAM-dependent methyltransferase